MASSSIFRGSKVAATFMTGLFVTLVVACGGETRQAASPIPLPIQNSVPSGEPLPGTEEFGLSSRELTTSIEQVETGIAKCMNESGFEYVAADYSTVRKGMIADKSLPGISDNQFIARFGYGISTLYTGLAPQKESSNTPAKLGLGPKNLAIFNKLSPAEQVAYNRALLGEHTEATFAVAVESEDLSRTGGCTRTAISQVFTPEQLKATYYNPLDARIEQDPRMVAALRTFADCVAAKGFKYDRPGDIEPAIKKRLDEITGGTPLESLSATAQSALKELQNEERDTARVAQECTIKYVEPVEEQIQRELYAGMVQ